MRRAVAGPGEGFTARDWVVVLRRVRKEASEDNVGLIAAGVAFWTFLSLIPLLIGVMAIAALFFGPVWVREQLEPLNYILPRPVAHSLTGQLSNAITAMGGQGRVLGLIIGLLGVLWTCARGFGALIDGLHVVIDEPDSRNIIHKRAVAFVLAAGALATALGTLGSVAKLPRIGLRDANSLLGLVVRCALFAIVAMVGLILLYRYGADRKKADWHAVRWGAGIAMAAWVVMSIALATYTAYTGGKNSTYGTLAGAVAIATWLYMSCYIVLLGAEINAEIERLLARRAVLRDDPPEEEKSSAAEGEQSAKDEPSAAKGQPPAAEGKPPATQPADEKPPVAEPAVEKPSAGESTTERSVST